MAASEPLIPIRMIRPTLDGLSMHALPAPFVLRWYRPGDERIWVDIAGRADLYNNVTEDLFWSEFGAHRDLLGQRQCYLCDGAGQAIGTAAAWVDPDFRGQARRGDGFTGWTSSPSIRDAAWAGPWSRRSAIACANSATSAPT
jgi:hypothetical protein